MPLHESAKAANVVGSLQAYVNTELADVLNSSAPAIDYGGGLPFQDSELEEWVQVRAIGPARPAGMAGPYAHRAGESDPDARGGELFWVLNVNCFVRPVKLASPNNLRAWTLRDMVLGILAPGTRVTVKDHAGQGETLGYLFVDDIMDDRALPDMGRPDVVQHNLVFALRWVETWVVRQ